MQRNHLVHPFCKSARYRVVRILVKTGGARGVAGRPSSFKSECCACAGYSVTTDRRRSTSAYGATRLRTQQCDQQHGDGNNTSYPRCPW
ncbi:unnamed protein product [Pieris brassicae]|uniref:Uncharacterized protein n=1 Tax=Pieris brassicae TaxID=7116 RepID=A0A9P0XG50_PIEBR|nr:unnamed protein product [Pieris brassicae]